METENLVRTYKDIRADYTFTPDIMGIEDERVAAIKEIISTKLSDVDRTIILLYVDCQSYRKLGKRMGLSHMTIRSECLRIKRHILDEYNKIYPAV